MSNETGAVWAVLSGMCPRVQRSRHSWRGSDVQRGACSDATGRASANAIHRGTAVSASETLSSQKRGVIGHTEVSDTTRGWEVTGSQSP